MSVRFFADHCVPAEMTDSLAQHGHQVVLLRDAMPPRSPDSLVIQKAQQLECVLLSLNGDFSDIVTYAPSDYGGIVAINCTTTPRSFRT